MVFGGYHTTATLLCLVVYFLSRSPDDLERLKEEHEAIRRSKEEGEPLSWEDYREMKFTHMVIWEALRYGNIVKALYRKASQDVQYKDFVIPSGWLVLPVLSAAHLDSTIHENPQEFNPMRWEDETTVKKVAPFGGGPRLCPGYDLAKVEICIFLHHFILRYRWKTKPDEFPVSRPYVEFNRGLPLEMEATRGI